MDNKEFSDLNEEGKADFAKAYREKYSEKNFPDAKRILFGRTLPDGGKVVVTGIDIGDDELKSEIQYTPITEDSYDGKKLSHTTIDEQSQFHKPPKE